MGIRINLPLSLGLTDKKNRKEKRRDEFQRFVRENPGVVRNTSEFNEFSKKFEETGELPEYRVGKNNLPEFIELGPKPLLSIGPSGKMISEIKDPQGNPVRDRNRLVQQRAAPARNSMDEPILPEARSRTIEKLVDSSFDGNLQDRAKMIAEMNKRIPPKISLRQQTSLLATIEARELTPKQRQELRQIRGALRQGFIFVNGTMKAPLDREEASAWLDTTGYGGEKGDPIALELVDNFKSDPGGLGNAFRAVRRSGLVRNVGNIFGVNVTGEDIRDVPRGTKESPFTSQQEAESAFNNGELKSGQIIYIQLPDGGFDVLQVE